MRDPNAGKYSKIYQREFELAQFVLESEHGEFEWSQHDWQAFTFNKPGVSLVFYPHKTAAGHRHIRVRDQGSKDKPAANRIMEELDDSINECTFHRKAR